MPGCSTRPTPRRRRRRARPCARGSCTAAGTPACAVRRRSAESAALPAGEGVEDRAHDPVDVPVLDDGGLPGIRLDQVAGIARRDDGEDRPTRGEVREDLARQDPRLAHVLVLAEQEEEEVGAGEECVRLGLGYEPDVPDDGPGPLAPEHLAHPGGVAPGPEKLDLVDRDQPLAHDPAERPRECLGRLRAVEEPGVGDRELRKRLDAAREVVAVEAVQDRHQFLRGERVLLRVLLGDPLGRGHDPVRGAERLGLEPFVSASEGRVDVGDGVRRERPGVAEVEHERKTRLLLEARADPAGRERRDAHVDQVDLVVADDPPARPDRVRDPADVRVGDDQLRLDPDPAEGPLDDREVVRDVPGAVDRDAVRDRFVRERAVEPVGVPHGEDVRVPAEGRQVLRELERPDDPDAADRRILVGDEEGVLHRRTTRDPMISSRFS